MTILLPPVIDAPLEQGDVLAEIALYKTASDGEAVAVGEPQWVMIVSRPCNAIRDETVVVVPIDRGPATEIRGATSPDEMRRAYLRIRDGEGALDRFYLGSLRPGEDARYFASLNEFYTIEVPSLASEREEFLRKHRRFRLDPAFARDLHLRIVRAFASLGFDDTAWWADEDLDLFIAQCDAWLAKASAAVRELETRRKVLLASGDPSKKELKTLDEELKQAQGAERKIREQYALEKLEHERRRGSKP